MKRHERTFPRTIDRIQGATRHLGGLGAQEKLIPSFGPTGTYCLGLCRGIKQYRCGSRREALAAYGRQVAGSGSGAGVDGLLDEPSSGAPRKITDQQVEGFIVKTLETQPRGATHWSTRSMAQASRLTRTTIARIWRA